MKLELLLRQISKEQLKQPCISNGSGPLLGFNRDACLVFVGIHFTGVCRFSTVS